MIGRVLQSAGHTCHGVNDRGWKVDQEHGQPGIHVSALAKLAVR